MLSVNHRIGYSVIPNYFLPSSSAGLLVRLVDIALMQRRVFSFCMITLLPLWLMGSTGIPLPKESDPSSLALADSIPGEAARPVFQMRGYIKYMQTTTLFNDDLNGFPSGLIQQLYGKALHDHLIHQRIDSDWYITPTLQFTAALRTRVIYGDVPRLYHLAGLEYGKSLDSAANDLIRMSALLAHNQTWTIHAVLDRLHMTWRGKNNELKIGRQRINWGIASVWNPNDLFNAYSFLDFDYEERPGSDAMRYTHYFQGDHRIEYAMRPARHIRDAIIGGLYRGHVAGTNYQVITAWYQGDMAIGAGLEVDAWGAAAKLEATYFHTVDGIPNRDNALAAALDVSYIWPSGLLGSAGYFLNTAPNNQDFFVGNSSRLTAKQLFPYRHNTFIQSSYPITPLLSMTLAVIYSPMPSHATILQPIISYSLASDWDLDFVGQIFFQEQEKKYQSPFQSLFLRIRWSYGS